jgi:DNA-directed RNA polymerase subunit RPC12/RpoP
MPRKPRVLRPPPKHPRIRSAPRVRCYYQCLHCGAPVDEVLVGDGDNNFCPSCHESGEVVCSERHLPDPPLYGQWLRTRKEAERNAVEPEPVHRAAPNLVIGDTVMKMPKLHTGIYSCLHCYIEFDLIGESSLKCDTCGGPLSRGTLEDLTGEEFEEDEDH